MSTRDSSPLPLPSRSTSIPPNPQPHPQPHTQHLNAPDLLTRLLTRSTFPAHAGECNHGTFSPHAPSTVAGSPPGSAGTSPRLGPVREGSFPIVNEGGIDETTGLLGKGREGGGGGIGERGSLRSRKRRGSEGGRSRWEWWSYYIPCVRWMGNYKREFFIGDLVSGITMASIYIPISFSLASNLAHIPPLYGLLSFAIQPLFYALLGSCSTLAVGPEAAGSLLLGSAVRLNLGHHDLPPGESSEEAMARLAGIVTGLAGAMALVAGIGRLGFLDAVLSRSFLRGFISAVGWVIVVDQLVPELGLQHKAKVDGIAEWSSIEKLYWIYTNLDKAHKLTALVAGVSFAVCLLGRTLKNRLERRIPHIIFLPDRLLIVLLSILLTAYFRWDQQGLTILGEIRAGDIQVRNPFQQKNVSDMKELLSTAFLIAVLGFFESTVAAKSIEARAGPGESSFSSNRELVALGVANLTGGLFGALPAFGGYGRSKLNSAAGGRTPMANIILAAVTAATIAWGLWAFYYLPRAVLSSMISVIAVSLLEEAPADLGFFWRIGGWSELSTIAVIFLTTAFFSLELGIAMGVFISVIAVIRASNRPRISILARHKATGQWVRADANAAVASAEGDAASEEGDILEQIEGVLVVKIPEPLIFANSGQLRARLDRLERYGSLSVHPSRPSRSSSSPLPPNRKIIFDIHGMTGLDGSGAQVLLEIVRGYRGRGTRVYFCRCVEGPVWERLVRSGVVEVAGGRGYFLRGVEEALAREEIEGGREEV